MSGQGPGALATDLIYWTTAPKPAGDLRACEEEPGMSLGDRADHRAEPH